MPSYHYQARTDFGNSPFTVNISEASKQNQYYRSAIWTGEHLQVTLMSINVGDDIGLEIHPNTDQFFALNKDKVLSKWVVIQTIFTLNQSYLTIVPLWFQPIHGIILLILAPFRLNCIPSMLLLIIPLEPFSLQRRMQWKHKRKGVVFKNITPFLLLTYRQASTRIPCYSI